MRCSMATKLTLTPDGFKHWKLVNDFTVLTTFGAITVPQDSRTDLASIPRIFWQILPPFGRYSQAAVVHDYLYFSHQFDRKTADKIFYELMLQYGTWKWKAKLMYYAVRLFAPLAWK